MRIEEASYGRIYQHTRDNGTFAIIGSEDKDTHKSRYDELKALIKEYESKYGHLGYNRLSGTYQYKLTGETTNEKSVIIYDIELKDALSIAKKINQESIVWKENTFFGIIDVNGGVLDRFKKSALNFSKAVKQGIGSRLMSDQTRTFGYAFEEVRLVRKNNLSECILINLRESKEEYTEKELDDWWENNWKRAIYYTQVEDGQTLADIGYNGDFEAYSSETAKHVGIAILYALGIKGFEELLDEYEIPKEDEIKEDKNGFPIIGNDTKEAEEDLDDEEVEEEDKDTKEFLEDLRHNCNSNAYLFWYGDKEKQEACDYYGVSREDADKWAAEHEEIRKKAYEFCDKHNFEFFHLYTQGLRDYANNVNIKDCLRFIDKNGYNNIYVKDLDKYPEFKKACRDYAKNNKLDPKAIIEPSNYWTGRYMVYFWDNAKNRQLEVPLNDVLKSKGVK